MRLVSMGAGIALAVSALLAIGLILTSHDAERLASTPIEGRLDDVMYESTEPVTGVDWDFWKSVNPDIIAWITIPGTPIDNPIVQASPDDPTHYLNYDIYNNYNIYGCLYVDAASSIEAPNTIIFGHNMGYYDESMFTTLTYYLNEDYLLSYPDVIIQTPDDVFALKVRAADEVSPYGYTKEMSFSSVEALRDFYLERWEESATKCAEPETDEVEQLFTLVTCDSDGATRAIVYVA